MRQIAENFFCWISSISWANQITMQHVWALSIAGAASASAENSRHMKIAWLHCTQPIPMHSPKQTLLIWPKLWNRVSNIGSTAFALHIRFCALCKHSLTPNHTHTYTQNAYTYRLNFLHVSAGAAAPSSVSLSMLFFNFVAGHCWYSGRLCFFFFFSYLIFGCVCSRSIADIHLDAMLCDHVACMPFFIFLALSLSIIPSVTAFNRVSATTKLSQRPTISHVVNYIHRNEQQKPNPSAQITSLVSV